MKDIREHMPDAERMKELLVGKKVVSATVRDVQDDESWDDGPFGYLTLSDGTQLKLWGNDGGCSCGAGDYPLETLNRVDNVITNVEIEERPDGDDMVCDVCSKDYCREHEQPERGFYRVFVYAGDERINLASFEGSDGNGYYGTGWWLSVVKETS